jgi:hypothetical protein
LTGQYLTQQSPTQHTHRQKLTKPSTFDPPGEQQAGT